MIDGVFFDCFNYAYSMPTPWNRVAVNVPGCTPAGGAGCEALLQGTIELARAVAETLNKGGKANPPLVPSTRPRAHPPTHLDVVLTLPAH